MRFWLAIIVVLLLAAIVRAEIVTETDGTVLQGKIEKFGTGWNVTQDDGKVIFVDAAKVASIAPGHMRSNAAEAQDKLASLRRTVSQMPDLQAIIAKYNQFISQNANAKVAEDAKADLTQWTDRQAKGLVKLGDKWITAEERAARRAKGEAAAMAAVDLIRQGRPQDGEEMLKQAIADDPQNGTALYLQGVAFYNAGQFDKSQAAFEASNTATPGNAPTLNNLGVLAARLHAFLPSINYYEQAMLASPQTRQVLDNVAEALNAVPVEYHNAPILAKTAATFQTQDLAMQQIEARDGLFRWGSSWVTAQQLRQLKTAEVEVNKQLDAIKRQNDALQDEIDHIDRDIAANSRQMNRMAASQTQIDQNGNSYQFPLPPLYYSMSDDNAKLQDEKKPLLAKQADLQENAKQVQHAMPKPPFSGIQHLMGPEALQTGFQTATQPSPSPGQ